MKKRRRTTLQGVRALANASAKRGAMLAVSGVPLDEFIRCTPPRCHRRRRRLLSTAARQREGAGPGRIVILQQRRGVPI